MTQDADKMVEEPAVPEGDDVEEGEEGECSCQYLDVEGGVISL